VWLGQFTPQRLGDRPRDTGGRVDLIQGVTVTFKELDLLSAQAEDLVAVGRLKHAQQRLCVEAIGHDGQLGNRPLESVSSEQTPCTQHCQSVEGVLPEVAVFR